MSSPTLYHRFGKRLFDLFFAGSAILFLLPLCLIIALAVKCSSEGPILIVQERIGKNGKKFSFLKFRSMYVENSVLRSEAQLLAQQGMLLKIDNDPRVTPVGFWLRKTSLDELPQLLNVLRGDMSLVGPRPLLPFMVEQHQHENLVRSQVLPGLTGYWQIKARSESSSILQMITYDVSYIEQCSFKTDLQILLHTIPTVVRGEGAK